MLLADHSRLAGNTARRTNGNRTELRRAVYSPCDLCKSDPSAPPAWQLAGPRDRSRQRAQAGRIPRRHDGNRRLAGLLQPVHVDPRPYGQARDRVSATVLRRLEHRRSANNDPLFHSARTGQGSDPGAAHYHQGGPAAGGRVRTAFWQRLSRRHRQHQPQQSERTARVPETTRFAATSTSTACSISTTPGAPASTCSASPIRAICWNSALATRC